MTIRIRKALEKHNLTPLFYVVWDNLPCPVVEKSTCKCGEPAVKIIDGFGKFQTFHQNALETV